MLQKNANSDKKPLIIAVETSGRTGSVAMAIGRKLLGQATLSAPMKHSAEIFPAITTLLNAESRKSEQIEQIYISLGPGSFTGLRIAVTLAKIMSFACNTKIVAVDTLDIIAANASDYMKEKDTSLEKIAVILDAKRGQFFIAVYENQNDKWLKITDDCIMTATEFVERFANPDKPIFLLGEGLVFYKDKFKSAGIEFLDEDYWTPKAVKVYQLGYKKALDEEFTDALELKPAYLRRPDIGKKKQKNV